MGAMDGRVCIVTGSNTGIGKETARGLASLGATVVMGCRDSDKSRAARDELSSSTGRNDVTLIPLDLASKAAIREFAAEFRKRFDRLDVLVNNAGVSQTRRTTTADGFESDFGVNHLGTFLLTHELLELLQRSAPSRVVVVSSRLHARGKMEWDDLQFERRAYNGFAAYNQSKLANVLFAGALARRLGSSGVTVNALHPGFVATELIRDVPRVLQGILRLFQINAVEGAACSLYVATSPEVAGESGAYFVKSRKVPAARAALDEAAQERLWRLSEQLLGLG